MKAEAPRQVARTNSTNAPVNVCVFKISDCAGDLWSSYRESNPPQKLFQIQARVANKKSEYEHAARDASPAQLRAGRS